MELTILDFGNNAGRRASTNQRLRSCILGPLPSHTDFSSLRSTRLLAILDDDNLVASLRDHGVYLSHRKLHCRLVAEAQTISAWAIFRSLRGDDRRKDHLLRSHWRVLAVPREMVMTVHGLCTKANADMDLCFAAGYLLRGGAFDTVLIGSGDGDLCVSIARGIRRMPTMRGVYTLSVPGSTSSRITSASGSELFAGNFLVGRDLTEPATAER